MNSEKQEARSGKTCNFFCSLFAIRYSRRAPRGSRGFTLIEMLVSVALFAIVMLIAGSTLLSLVYANRKAQALQSVMNNLNISLDDMVRNVRMGSNYRCGSQEGTDCASGATSSTSRHFGADPSNRS